ncbi:MAG: hypothetical protein Q8Q05_03135 [bacterium]|nr:hypothetical protein [bacterium]
MNYEIEIKCLLGSRVNAEKLVKAMGLKDPKLAKVGTQKQLNHYFEGGNLADLYQNVRGLITDKNNRSQFESLIDRAKNFSLRTRSSGGQPLLVLKVSIDDTSSDNGTARLELELAFDTLGLEELDQLVLKSGFVYQAKWSREKTDYNYLGANVTISFSPGYGYVAEFEKIITDPKKADQTKTELRQLMSELEIEELAQDRLARMFAYYNANWQDYYSTDKVFEIL